MMAVKSKAEAQPVALQLSKSATLRYKAQLDALAQHFGRDLSKPMKDIANISESWNWMALGYFDWCLSVFLVSDKVVLSHQNKEYPHKSIVFFKNSTRHIDEKIVALWNGLMKEASMV